MERQIFLHYSDSGESHGLGHVQCAIKSSLALAAVTGVDVNIAYIIAAYYDLGMAGPRATRRITSSKILITDARLGKWFSTEQLKIMKETVEDHRASGSRVPHSIYGGTIAEADCDLEPEVVLSRAILYGTENCPEKSDEQMRQRFRDHTKEKYGRSGYLKLRILSPPDAKNLETIHKTIDNEAESRKVFNHIYKQIREQDEENQQNTAEMTKEELMRRAIELSADDVRNGGGPLGAVIARNGEIIAEGSNGVTVYDDPTAHVKASIVRKACQKLNTLGLSGCEICTSCEPCPMCFGAIHWVHLDKIHYASDRGDATDIGFDDDFIYQGIAVQPQYRKKPLETLLRNEALEVSKQWTVRADKAEY